MKSYAMALLCLMLPLRAQNKEHRTFGYGFEQRVRNENWDNIVDFNDSVDDQRAQVRYRTRLWMKAPLATNIDFHVGLNQESNQIVSPGTPLHFDEVIFETAYFDIKKLFVKGLSLKVGRQNIMKGEGFLILEGDPWDGSRSVYFNAAVLGYEWKKSKLEAIGIWDPGRDRYLPRINDRSRRLVEWDEQALGAYYTDNNLKHTSFEAYYFYKKETGDYRLATNPQYQPDRHVHTAGGRAVRKLPRGWSLHSEFALQWGAQHPNTSISAWGGYTYAKRTFGNRGRYYLSGGYWGMSGDDPNTTGRIEGWDPLFARWPKWSEMYIYSQLRERGVAYWTNTGLWQGEFGYSPSKPVQGRLTYYRMTAFHPFPGDPNTFGSGTGRGNYPQARVDIALNKHWKGHALYEYLAPGSFYSHGPSLHFLRFEVIYTHQGSASF